MLQAFIALVCSVIDPGVCRARSRSRKRPTKCTTFLQTYDVFVNAEPYGCGLAFKTDREDKKYKRLTHVFIPRRVWMVKLLFKNKTNDESNTSDSHLSVITRTDRLARGTKTIRFFCWRSEPEAHSKRTRVVRVVTLRRNVF
jgi:hypothetical protein